LASPDISNDRVERALCSRFGVRPEDITLSRSPSADFLVTFVHRHYRDVVVATRGFLHGNLDFRIRQWQLIALGDCHGLKFHVTLCLEGIPPQAWNECIAKRVVAHACVLDYVEEGCLSPASKMPAVSSVDWESIRHLQDRLAGSPSWVGAMIIHNNAPPPTGLCGLTFKLLIYIDLVEGQPDRDGMSLRVASPGAMM
jgi:hypothetical protein